VREAPVEEQMLEMGLLEAEEDTLIL